MSCAFTLFSMQDSILEPIKPLISVVLAKAGLPEITAISKKNGMENFKRIIYEKYPPDSRMS